MALTYLGDTASPVISGRGAFEEIWAHYESAHFIYPAKMQRLMPALRLIETGWPLLLEADADLFQFHAAKQEGKIVSSVCAFRDTHDTYVFQHAASAGQPLAMIACIRAGLAQINSDPTFACARIYYRPENRWPARTARAIARAIGPDHSTYELHDYLFAKPSNAARGAERAEAGLRIRELLPSEQDLAIALARRAVGRLRARALGFDHPDLTLHTLNTRWLAAGLRRVRRVLVVEQYGALAGLALCHASSVPINFSFLCSRTELLIHPDAIDRGRLVTALARASLAEARSRGDPYAVMLTHPDDTAAAVNGGYQATQKQYASFIWARENEYGAPSAIAGVDGLYEPIAGRMRNARVPAMVGVDRE